MSQRFLAGSFILLKILNFGSKEMLDYTCFEYYI